MRYISTIIVSDKPVGHSRNVSQVVETLKKRDSGCLAGLNIEGRHFRSHNPFFKRSEMPPFDAILRAGLHHAAHAGIHGRCGLGLRDVDDGTLGSEEHAGH